MDDEREKELAVDAIHNERGYTKVRRALARHYDVSRHDPDIQIVDVDLEGDRRLELRHQIVDGVTLDEDDTERVLQHLANLWGYEVHLIESSAEGEPGTKHHATRFIRSRRPPSVQPGRLRRKRVIPEAVSGYPGS